MIIASDLLGKRVRVESIEGEVVHVLPANLRPRREEILKYYYNNNEDSMESSVFVKNHFKASKFDRVVVKRDNGFYCIIPFRSSFIFDVV